MFLNYTRSLVNQHSSSFIHFWFSSVPSSSSLLIKLMSWLTHLTSYCSVNWKLLNYFTKHSKARFSRFTVAENAMFCLRFCCSGTRHLSALNRWVCTHPKSISWCFPFSCCYQTCTVADTTLLLNNYPIRPAVLLSPLWAIRFARTMWGGQYLIFPFTATALPIRALLLVIPDIQYIPSSLYRRD